jgi:C_GCAxxG_C_C family probable redox protein
MKNKSEIAADAFNRGFNCAQSVLISHCEEFDIPETTAKKIACGFGGGMGHTGEVCGAVAGATMLIGLKYGKHTESDNEAKEKTYNLVKKFTDNFKKEFGSINCSELLKYDLSKENQLQAARKSGIFKEVCPVLVKRSVELVEKLLG